MSEIKKNIETCRGEDVLAEVSALPQDPHFGSLVNEALDPMQQQALRQAGYDGYSEVIEQHKPYTFASAIIQMKSNLLLLLRALWQFPFGSDTLRSLSDMWQHYITRLQGNETYGIPSRLSSLTDLPSAPLLVADRKISGVPEAADGMSMVHLLADPLGIEELTDDNKYRLTRQLTVKTYFPNCSKVTMGCTEIQVPFEYDGGVVFGSDCEYYLPNLKKIIPSTAGGFGHGIFNGNVQSHDIDLGDTEEIATGGFFGLIRCRGSITDYRYALIARKLRKCSYLFSRYDDSQIGITKVVLGKIETNNFQPYYVYGSPVRTPNLIHWEFGQDTAVSLNLQYWNPTNALDASLDTLVTDEDCHNNLEQFLKNFRTYIALRLADNGSGKTLTLSAAVFSSIWDANGNPQVLGDGLDKLRADIHNIVKTTKHWDVNKAS